MTDPNWFESALQWESDRLLIGDLVLRLQYVASADWELGDRCLAFFKDRRVVDIYASIFKSRPAFQPETIFELGIWDGGSVAFWYECFEPSKLIAIDLQNRDDSPYFREWLERRGAANRVRTHWRTDQADRNRLTEILGSETTADLDLVIDDASHLYSQSLASLETLLPFLRPGGLYILEDWNWGHWPAHFGLGRIPLTRLVLELVEALGSGSGPVCRVDVYPDLVVLERGSEALPRDGSFRLQPRIRRRPRYYRAQNWLRRRLARQR